MHRSPRVLGLLVLAIAFGAFAVRSLMDSNPSKEGPAQEVSDAAPEPQPVSESTDDTLVNPELDEVEVISFDDLKLGMPVDSVFRPLMLQFNEGRAKSLLGKRINVGGYMNPTDSLTGVKEFILLRNLECKFGPGGQADHLVRVMLEADLTTNFTDKIVYVEGVLELNPFPVGGASTWSIYDMKATKVSTNAPPRSR